MDPSCIDNAQLESIAQYLIANQRDYTYVGIGSAPRTAILEDLNSVLDQIIPEFVRDVIENTNKTITLVHFDPRFNDFMDFLLEYFDAQPYNIIHDKSEYFNKWISTDYRIEILMFNFSIYNPNHDWFYEQLINSTISKKNQLVVQQFTGLELTPIFKNLYKNTINKDIFKQKVLFDITYGSECNCMTDMSKYKPLHFADGNFINIQLMEISELRSLFNTNEIINTFIKNHYIKEYRKIIDIIPVDYRRKMKIENDETVLKLTNYKDKYTIDSSYEEIIEILKTELIPIISIFREIKFMTPEKETILHEILTNYKNYTLTSKPDVYKWSDEFIKIIRD